MKMRNMTVMHKKYLRLEQYHYNYNNSHYNNTITIITVGVIADCYCSLLCPSSAPALIVIVYNLFRSKKKGHEWPRLTIISASKAENMKKMALHCCL